MTSFSMPHYRATRNRKLPSSEAGADSRSRHILFDLYRTLQTTQHTTAQMHSMSAIQLNVLFCPPFSADVSANTRQLHQFITYITYICAISRWHALSGCTLLV